MCRPFYCVLLCLLALLQPIRAQEPKIRVIALGDSITRGVRTGVKADETFAALLQVQLKKDGLDAEVTNIGIGGERTDQALTRLKKAVIEKKPTVVTIMYGTNDSYVDRGKKDPRLSPEQYGENLTSIVKQLQDAGIRPVLMTPPRWGDKANPNGAGDNPNVLLEKYVEVCRKVATDTKTPLIDHFAHWTKKAKDGTNISKWMTDECHPNPEGHKVLAETMTAVILEAVKAK